MKNVPFWWVGDNGGGDPCVCGQVVYEKSQFGDIPKNALTKSFLKILLHWKYTETIFRIKIKAILIKIKYFLRVIIS